MFLGSSATCMIPHILLPGLSSIHRVSLQVMRFVID
jgi:hypothetical protein